MGTRRKTPVERMLSIWRTASDEEKMMLLRIVISNLPGKKVGAFIDELLPAIRHWRRHHRDIPALAAKCAAAAGKEE
jgi:hypothetical protein